MRPYSQHQLPASLPACLFISATVACVIIDSILSNLDGVLLALLESGEDKVAVLALELALSKPGVDSFVNFYSFCFPFFMCVCVCVCVYVFVCTMCIFVM